MTNKAVVYTGVHEIAIEPCAAAPAPRAEEALVRTQYSAVSRGTERLIFEGRVPPSEYARMRAPLQRGGFPFPVTYGYAAVGVVEAGPEAWLGRRVFALHPHQLRFTAPLSLLTPIPDAVPSRRAPLAANMETALNALWDAGFGPGDRLAVVGGGVLGLMVAGLAASTPGAEVAVVDPEPGRRALVEALGARFEPEWASEDAAAAAGFDADLAVHSSATEAGARAALALLGFEGRLIELSWYGDRAPSLPLGAAFHSRRLSVISSQVGHVSPGRRPRWPHGRRLAKAVELLADARYEALITDEIAFEAAAEALPPLLAAGATGLATVLRYPAP